MSCYEDKYYKEGIPMKKTLPADIILLLTLVERLPREKRILVIELVKKLLSLQE